MATKGVAKTDSKKRIVGRQVIKGRLLQAKPCPLSEGK
jgi:hypothetical protein